MCEGLCGTVHVHVFSLCVKCVCVCMRVCVCVCVCLYCLVSSLFFSASVALLPSSLVFIDLVLTCQDILTKLTTDHTSMSTPLQLTDRLRDAIVHVASGQINLAACM